jgi:hypothetical protein
MAALVRAEIKWLRAVGADLRSGRLTWSEKWLRQFTAKWASQAGNASPAERAPMIVSSDCGHFNPAAEHGRRIS